MTREERAKQFMPFDAMKGLKEALLDREERHTRVEKREISEEAAERNSAVLRKLTAGNIVTLDYYRAFHNVQKTGAVGAIDFVYCHITVDGERIYFDDIYDICLTDVN